MANNTFQVKRSSTAGRQPNTTSSSNTQYINPGEFALNMTDQILYTSDGTNLITIGANSSKYSVGTSFIANSTQLTISSIALNANGSNGTSGQVLTSNGSATYWSTVTGGGGGSVNVAAQYTWTNTQTFTNVITHSANVVLTAGITANNTGGLNTQVLMSNGGGGTFWGYMQPTGYAVRQEYTANGSQNTFTVTGGYVANNIDVYLNGVKLLNTVEVNTASGSTFTILAGTPANGTSIEVVGATTIAAGGATGSNGDQVFFVGSQTITASYNIPTGKSAMAVGPVTLNNGVTVTVPSGSRWVVL